MSQSRSYAYRAFLSYSHRDHDAGEKLHKSLENFRIPWGIAGKSGTYSETRAALEKRATKHGILQFSCVVQGVPVVVAACGRHTSSRFSTRVTTQSTTITNAISTNMPAKTPVTSNTLSDWWIR